MVYYVILMRDGIVRLGQDIGEVIGPFTSEGKASVWGDRYLSDRLWTVQPVLYQGEDD